MPGGRLTQQERQQIALGLADGLAYAEIARRLDRPTSTITREVMRNGGPTAYRADLAHRATERRARRRRHAARQAATPAPGSVVSAGLALLTLRTTHWCRAESGSYAAVTSRTTGAGSPRDTIPSSAHRIRQTPR